MTKQDPTRPAGSQIKYRLFDEYRTEFAFRNKHGAVRFLRATCSISWILWNGTAIPEWERFGFVLSFNECNLDCGTDLETPRDFTSVGSDHYADLASHYRSVRDEWYPPKKSAGVDN
jgi:hypothetical protein